MLAVHRLLTNTILLYLLVCAVWGIATGIRQRPVAAGYRGALLITEALFVVQGLVGFALLAQGAPVPQWIHFLYGVVGVVALPVALGYLSRGAKREGLWLGLTALFLGGIAIRALMTGHP
jgi:hypothetical protein